MLGNHRRASETPLKWRFAGMPIMARFSGIWDRPSLYQLNKTWKNVIRVGPPLTKHNGSAQDNLVLVVTIFVSFLTYEV